MSLSLAVVGILQSTLMLSLTRTVRFCLELSLVPQSSRTVVVIVVSSRTELYDDLVVDDVTSVSALDVVEIKLK